MKKVRKLAPIDIREEFHQTLKKNGKVLDIYVPK